MLKLFAHQALIAGMFLLPISSAFAQSGFMKLDVNGEQQTVPLSAGTGTSSLLDGKVQISWVLGFIAGTAGEFTKYTLAGSVTVINQSAQEVASSVDYYFDLPTLLTPTDFEGSGSLMLTMNSNGGYVTSNSTAAQFNMLLGNGSVAKMFDAPFMMGSSGAGTAQTSKIFSGNTSGLGKSVGMSLTSKITDGEKLAYNFSYVVQGTAIEAPEDSAVLGNPLAGGAQSDEDGASDPVIPVDPTNTPIPPEATPTALPNPDGGVSSPADPPPTVMDTPLPVMPSISMKLRKFVVKKPSNSARAKLDIKGVGGNTAQHVVLRAKERYRKVCKVGEFDIAPDSLTKAKLVSTKNHVQLLLQATAGTTLSSRSLNFSLIRENKKSKHCAVHLDKKQ